MAELTFNEPYHAHGFAIEIEGTRCPLTKVTGLSEGKVDAIYLIYNDTGENLFLKQGDKVQQFEITGKDALVTLSTIDEDGITHREALFSPEKRDAKVCPKDCLQLADDRMFLYASRKKEYRFGLVTFD